jgi:two-component system, chemotaxis family, chemotaxis protein CheY
MPALLERATILVIDDDEDVVDVIRFVLESAGYAVVCALDGRAGLEVAFAAHPDLILLDLRMPVMDGPTFAEEFRRRGGSTPIVVVTAADDARRRAAAIQAAGWIAKPFEPADLVRLVARQLAGEHPGHAET